LNSILRVHARRSAENVRGMAMAQRAAQRRETLNPEETLTLSSGTLQTRPSGSSRLLKAESSPGL